RELKPRCCWRGRFGLQCRRRGHYQYRLRIRVLNGSNETVAASRQCFDIARLVGRVPQRLAQPVHGRVQSVLKIDERTACPKLLLKLVPGDHLARLPDESRQNLQRLSLKPKVNSMLVQLARCCIEGEGAKHELPGRSSGGITAHGVTQAQAYHI